ncbi:MAG TPA: YceI family protein [Chthoniobacterales bacterium]|nr:YceI family protein [Chthoniobacterales bacterium]
MTKVASTSRNSGPPRTAWTVWVILACGLFAAWPSAAFGNESYKFDQTRSTIAFKVRHLLGTAKGKFAKFSGTIEVDREHPEKSSVVATIQTASIDTANAKRDEHLRTADFFSVRQYREITFKSRRVTQTGPNAGEIAGDLTMHGVTRPITLNVQLLGDAKSAADTPTTRWRVTTAPLKRSDFGIGKGAGGEWMIGNDVAVEIEIEAARAR